MAGGSKLLMDGEKSVGNGRKWGEKVGKRLGKAGKILYLCIVKKSINKHTNLIYEN